ncbi:hypothetical protein CDAR_118121 [Caerostris darwini]|uniref:Uncharacterized protein n=1 Tax=Caerostris darwini TaxID=1538125 RepID=A0AAV4TDP9_9ARAC|nr:hypothetical protein CDAR_118121 [Caerostris darwini]
MPESRVHEEAHPFVWEEDDKDTNHDYQFGATCCLNHPSRFEIIARLLPSTPAANALANRISGPHVRMTPMGAIMALSNRQIFACKWTNGFFRTAGGQWDHRKA